MEVNLKYFGYYVIFKENSDINYSPIIKYNNKTMHLFDETLNGTLPIVEFIMHLPRITFDLYDIDESLIKASYDTPHIIILIPESKISILKEIYYEKTAIILSDNCSKSVKKECYNFSPVLGVYESKELTEKLIIESWKKISNINKSVEYNKVLDIEKHYFLHGKHMKALLLLYTSRQFGKVDKILYMIYNADDLERACSRIQLSNNTTLNTLVSMNINDVKSDNPKIKEIYTDIFDIEYKKFDVSIVITFPGVLKKQIKYEICDKELSPPEKNIIRVMGIHRAIARSGVLLELPNVTDELFEKYDQLEKRCKDGTNNKYI